DRLLRPQGNSAPARTWQHYSREHSLAAAFGKQRLLFPRDSWPRRILPVDSKARPARTWYRLLGGFGLRKGELAHSTRRASFFRPNRIGPVTRKRRRWCAAPEREHLAQRRVRPAPAA